MFRTSREMHDDIDFLTDKVATGRWKRSERNRALNFAQDYIVQERYDDYKLNKPYSFQSNQRIRDELRPIVVDDLLLVLSGKDAILPSDYRHLLLLELLMNGETDRVYSVATTYNQLGLLEDNPFSKPEKDYPKHIENQNGITFKTGSTDITNSYIYYIRNPIKIEFGDEKINSSLTLSLAVTLVANLTYTVISGGVQYTGTLYTIGQNFTVVSAMLFADLNSSTTIRAGNDCELPGHLHDEIINKAASQLQGITEDYNQRNLLEMEARKS